MTQEIFIEWVWWLPEFSNNKVSWTLKKNWNDFELSLNWKITSEWLKSINWWWSRIKYIDGVIHGLWKENSEKITLYKYFPKNQSFRIVWEWYDYETIIWTDLFIWEHIEDINSFEISDIRFSWSGIFEWLWKWLIEYKLMKDSDSKMIYELNLKFSSEYEVNIGEISNELSLSFIKGYKISPKSENFEEKWQLKQIFKWIEVTQSVEIRLYSIEGKKFYKFLDTVNNLKYFFSFILWFDIDFYDFRIVDYKGSTTIRLIHPFSSSLGFDGNRKRLKFLFCYESIDKEIFYKVIRNWFNKMEEYKWLYDTYFASMLTWSLHEENKFLNFIQSLEGYYWIKFWKGNKKKNLVIKLTEIYVWLNLDVEEDEIKYIKECRNILSHWSNRAEIYDNFQLFHEKTNKLWLLLELMIVKDLFDNDEYYENLKKVKVQQFSYENTRN